MISAPGDDPQRIVSGGRLRAHLDERAAQNEPAELMPGVWDPLSAMIAAESGFSTVFVSGYCVAGTQLGVPDIGLVTQTEMAEVARRICAAVPDTMVIVDADTGYGSPLNVIRTVELWEAAGAAGLFLEDQVWPKRCGHMPGKQVIERQEWLSKLAAALRHRRNLHVTARTDARATHGLDEAIERGRAARDLGVDAVFIEAPEDRRELERIATELDGVTLVANMVEHGRTPLLDPVELAELGFGLVVSPLSGLFAQVAALTEAYSALRQHGTLRAHLDRLVSFESFTSLVGLERFVEQDTAFRT